MHWSRYNILFKREHSYLLYNAITNAFAEVSEKLFQLFLNISAGGSWRELDQSVITNLIRMKALVHSDDLEICKIKHFTLLRRFNYENIILTINPTLACNFACVYCFEEKHPNMYMSEGVENSIIKYLTSRKSANSISVTWFGGEPLLYFDRIRSLSRKIIALGKRYSAGIITNGYLLTPEIASQFQELQISSVQVTIDGVGKEHDSRRPLKNGAPTYSKIIDNISYIDQNFSNIRVNIRVNIDKDSLSNFVHVYNELKDTFKNVSIHPAFVKDIYSDGTCNSVLSLSEKFRYMQDLYNSSGLYFNSFFPERERTECAARNCNAFVIGPEGELYKCWNDVGKKELVYGNIANIGAITNEDVFFDYLYEADPFDDSECRECKLLPICSGGCPHTRLHDKKMHTQNACPRDKNKIEDYLWAHYCTKKHIKIE